MLSPRVLIDSMWALAVPLNGSWKVVLRHADPLDTFRGPAFAHGLERE
jgi:hypothetical protein